MLGVCFDGVRYVLTQPIDLAVYDSCVCVLICICGGETAQVYLSDVDAAQWGRILL